MSCCRPLAELCTLIASSLLPVTYALSCSLRQNQRILLHGTSERARRAVLTGFRVGLHGGRWATLLHDTLDAQGGFCGTREWVVIVASWWSRCGGRVTRNWVAIWKSGPSAKNKMSAGVLIGLHVTNHNFRCTCVPRNGSNCSLDETRHTKLSRSTGCLRSQAAVPGVSNPGASRPAGAHARGDGEGLGAGRAGKCSRGWRWRQHAQAVPRSWIGHEERYAWVS